MHARVCCFQSLEYLEARTMHKASSKPRMPMHEDLDVSMIRARLLLCLCAAKCFLIARLLFWKIDFHIVRVLTTTAVVRACVSTETSRVLCTRVEETFQAGRSRKSYWRKVRKRHRLVLYPPRSWRRLNFNLKHKAFHGKLNLFNFYTASFCK